MTQVEQKPKRIKRVFTNPSEVMHRWANQTQSDARCKNAYFDGKSVFSYGSHYELGRLIEFRGRTVAVINDSGYSKTTSGHISSAWHAVEHMPRVKTPGDFSTGCVRRGLVIEQDKLVDDLFNHFKRVSFYVGEKQWGLKGEYGDVGGYAKQVSEFNAKVVGFGYPELALDINSDFIKSFDAKLVIGVERAKIKDAAKIAQRAADDLERQIQAKENVEAWRAGRQVSINGLSPQILRVNGDLVESSRGASVTLKEARAFLRAIETKKIKPGTKVGDYTFNGMTTLNSAAHERELAVKVDCHTIAVSELRAVVGASLSLVRGA